MNGRNRQKLLALAAGAAVALLAADRLVLTPLSQSWTARVERLGRLKQIVAQGSLLQDREGAIRSRWADIQTNCLPAEASAAQNQLLKAFDRWARESRVALNSIKPQVKRGLEAEAMTVECQVDAAGSLSGLSRLLYAMEGDPMALRLEAVELTSRDDRGEQLTLAVRVSGLMLSTPSRP